MRIVAGPRSQLLSHRIARALGVEVVCASVERFPDGEQDLRIAEFSDEEAAVVQSTRTDRDLVTLLLLLDAASRQASEVTAVVPYLGYARQDRVFRAGEPLSLAAVVRAANAQGGSVVTVDPHSDPSPHGDASFVSSAGALAEIVEPWKPDLVLAPDEGAIERAAGVAERVDVEHDHLVKTRLAGDEVSIQPRDLSVEDADVVIVDDVISTGDTMAKAVSMLIEAGAGSVSAAATHGVLTGSAICRLLSAGVEHLAVTDTVETPLSRGSVAPAVADVLR
ncbi:MAG: Ribose-phosphate pyrophosphokinase [Methanonatronarchaeales archaeon]|nr:Ribose-phosphate pyrophosphokinase [Methanonatronarchaeales archaeon]